MKHKVLHLQSLVAVALCVIMAIALTSCSNDDEPEKPEVEKLMKSLDKTSFVYKDGKIIQTLWSGSVDDDISYTKSKIEIGDETCYLKDGLVVKYVESNGYYHEITYKDRRIKTIKRYYSDGDLEEIITFEWKDGVIVRQTDVEYDDDGSTELYYDYHYNYTSDPDYGGAVAAIQYGEMLYDDLPKALIIQGYFGKLPKYLVSGAVDVSGNYDEPESYTYILDNDGYPLSMSGSYSAIFTWENVK